ncbi:MAG: hypothetical protein HYY93_02715 [Planctomycetes bacterium]|nr:hypothetical protein [Planctomycetota bacterium]
MTRLRRLPKHFAWIDHRLRDRLSGLSLEEIAILFFLHLAADPNGCSFWADSTIAKRLGLREGDIVQARFALLQKRLIAYRYPLYQLLGLEDAGSTASRQEGTGGDARATPVRHPCGGRAGGETRPTSTEGAPT